MLKNRGFISILSLIFMSIILLFSLFLLNVSKLEYCINNYNQDKVQSYYSAESKIHLILKEEKYYNQLLSKIEIYLKSGIIPKFEIIIDSEDLIQGDLNPKVNTIFAREENELLVELITQSSYNETSSNLRSKINIINQFYKLGIPILSEKTTNTDKISDYITYMDMVSEEIKVPDKSKKLLGLDATGYDRVNIIIGIKNRTIIEFYNAESIEPIKIEISNGRKLFFIAKDGEEKCPNINLFLQEGIDKGTLEGVTYIEGNLKVYNDIKLEGIIIINNGSIEVDSSAELTIEGLVLLKNYTGMNIQKQNNIIVNSNQKVVEQNGFYIPGFIDLDVQFIKTR